MRKQTDKKLISFSKLSLIDRFVKDEAEIENRSESAIIEAHLLESFLPKERNVRFWTEHYLYSEDGGIGKTLAAIFSTNAAGVDWGSKYDNLLPIVEFAKTQECFCDTIPTGEERELHHCCSQLDSVATKLEHLADEATDRTKKYTYQKEAKWANRAFCGNVSMIRTDFLNYSEWLSYKGIEESSEASYSQFLYEIDEFYGFVSLEDYLRGCLEETIISNQKTDNVIMGNDVYLVDIDSLLDICYATLFTLHNHVNSHKFAKNDKLNETIRFYFRDICKQIGADEIGERIAVSFI
ncbi:MAG: hypothetical protein UHN47_07475 [Lachnospiraceae bacterium]|nr:hypothetical protein [Lachnospiraceae bacterium]